MREIARPADVYLAMLGGLPAGKRPCEHGNDTQDGFPVTVLRKAAPPRPLRAGAGHVLTARGLIYDLNNAEMR